MVEFFSGRVLARLKFRVGAWYEDDTVGGGDL